MTMSLGAVKRIVLELDVQLAVRNSLICAEEPIFLESSLLGWHQRGWIPCLRPCRQPQAHKPAGKMSSTYFTSTYFTKSERC